MRQKSADLDVLMIFMRRTGASIYSLSKHSGLSVSAVRGRLASDQDQARLKDIEGQARDSDYAVVDLTRLSPAARAEVEATLSAGDSPDIRERIGHDRSRHTHLPPRTAGTPRIREGASDQRRSGTARRGH